MSTDSLQELKIEPYFPLVSSPRDGLDLLLNTHKARNIDMGESIGISHPLERYI